MPFPPLTITEGNHVDHFGNLIAVTYIDLRHPSGRGPLPLIVKGCRPEHAIENGSALKISTPRTFRHQGENLILDPGEGYFQESETIHEAIDDPGDIERSHHRNQALNRAAQLVGFDWKTQTVSTHRTVTRTKSFEYGPKGWLFCAAMEPATCAGWQEWWDALGEGYSHASPIYRPREFARALGGMVAEQLGPQGPVFPTTSTLKGWPPFRTENPTQMIFHGPVVYVDDVDDWLHSAVSEQEYFLRAVFTKNCSHQAQREYRFVVWAEDPPKNDTHLLQPSPALLDAMTARGNAPGPPVVPKMEPAAEDPAWDNEPTSNPLVGEKAWLSLAESFREQAKKPEAVVLPQPLDPASLPDDLHVRTAIYSGVEALRQKIGDFHMLEDETVERRNSVTAAAWFAEQDIRTLCETFDSPIQGISISAEGLIVVQVAIRPLPGLDCLLAVAPTGEATVRMDHGPGTRIVQSTGQFHRANVGQAVKEFIERQDLLPRHMEAGE